MANRTDKYPPKTLVHLSECRVFAATFVDGNQEADTRLVVAHGGNMHFLHPDGGDKKMKQPAGWLKDAVRSQAGDVMTKETMEDLPADEVEVPLA